MLGQASFKKIFTRYLPQLILLGILFFTCLVLYLSSPYFLTWDNIREVLDQSTVNLIIALGMTFVITSGGIDLSVGSVVALVGVIMAILLKANLPVGAVIFIGLITGLVLGGLNGIFISKVKVNPFIVTLASLSTFRGITLILTKGIPIYSFPQNFIWFGSGSFLGLTIPIFLCLLVIAISTVLLSKTRLGYYAKAIGSNEEALRRNGVKVSLYKTTIYMFSGFTAALAGLIITARLNSADPLAGYMFEMDAIATVILGGTNIKGGQGSILGTMLAGLFLAVLRNGLILHGIASYYQQLLVGVIILIAVAISERRLRT